tara:strand:+ start:1983 stop:3167 length:1185 start_codon:yes stop_codon:yes gene_type:complete
MSRRPRNLIDDDAGGERKRRRRRAVEHARAIRNLPPAQLEQHYRTREENRAALANALKQEEIEFKIQRIKAKRALQAQQRRAIKKAEKEEEDARKLAQDVARIRSRIAMDPVRQAAIDRYRARRQRILRSWYGIDLMDDDDDEEEEEEVEYESDDSWLASEDDEDDVDAGQYNAVMDALRIGQNDIGLSDQELRRREEIRQAQRKLVKDPLTDEEFQKARRNHDLRVGYTAEDELKFQKARDRAEEEMADALSSTDEEDAAIARGEGGELPSASRVPLTQMKPEEVYVNPDYYVPQSKPPEEKDTLEVNELRLLSPDDMIELMTDIEIEQESRGKEQHNTEARWDLTEYSDDVLQHILDFVKSMQEVFVIGLIETEAKPQPIGIGAMFRRLFLG